MRDCKRSARRHEPCCVDLNRATAVDRLQCEFVLQKTKTEHQSVTNDDINYLSDNKGTILNYTSTPIMIFMRNKSEDTFTSLKDCAPDLRLSIQLVALLEL
jgi:hypothetical protein